jgi:hypothetical protein
MMNVEGKCPQCVFFSQSGNGPKQCRRHAPIPLPVHRTNQLTQQHETIVGTVWPPVDETCWCGDFNPKEPAIATVTP